MVWGRQSWDKAPPGSADALTGCKVLYFAQGRKDQQHDTLMICTRQGTCEVKFSSTRWGTANHGFQAVPSPHMLEDFTARQGM